MVHTATRSPLSATIAVITAGAVVVAPMTIEPPSSPVALTAPTISIHAVGLTALAGPLPDARGAEVSANANSLVDVVQDIPAAIMNAIAGLIASPVQGAGAGIFLGFFGGGILAGNLLSWVPEGLAGLVTPISQARAVIGALIGAPIGAVLGPIIYVARAVSSVLSPPAPAAGARKSATTPRAATRPANRTNLTVGRSQRAHREDVASHRDIAKPAASRASAEAAPQQHSKSARHATGHARNAGSAKAAQSGR